MTNYQNLKDNDEENTYNECNYCEICWGSLFFFLFNPY